MEDKNPQSSCAKTYSKVQLRLIWGLSSLCYTSQSVLHKSNVDLPKLLCFSTNSLCISKTECLLTDMNFKESNCGFYPHHSQVHCFRQGSLRINNHNVQCYVHRGTSVLLHDRHDWWSILDLQIRTKMEQGIKTQPCYSVCSGTGTVALFFKVKWSNS